AGESVGFSGSASSSSGLLICVVLIFHHLQNTTRPLAILLDLVTSATKNRSAKLWASAACFFQIVRTYVRLGRVRNKHQTSRRRLFSSFGCKRPQIPSALNSSMRRSKTQVGPNKCAVF